MQQKQNPPTEVGVIIGRFQVDVLTDSHADLIQYVAKKHPKVIILLGVAKITGNKHDPLDFDSRRLMLQEKYPDFIILPVSNCREDEDWSRKVDETIQLALGPLQKATLYGGRDSFIPSYKGKWKTEELESPSSIYNVSGTMVRARLSQLAQSGQSFRAGIIYNAYQQYDRIIPTVDIAIVDCYKNRFLMCRKPGEKAFRFVGGFADKRDTSFEHTAKREVQEETGLSIGDPYSLGSFNIPDWRLKDTSDIIRTTLYVAPYISGAPIPNDDIEEVRWFDWKQDVRIDVVPEHNQMYMYFREASFCPIINKHYFIINHIRNNNTPKTDEKA